MPIVDVEIIGDDVPGRQAFGGTLVG